MARGARRPAGFPSCLILLLVAAASLPSGPVVAGSTRQLPPSQAPVADRLKEADRLATERRGAEALSLYLAVAEQARAESQVDLEAHMGRLGQ
jgi:hypothetical protein